jgi:phosphoribosylformylglycinamidine synthase
VDFPIRHGEGRLIESGNSLGVTAFPAFRYTQNPNGSHESIAGLIDPSGRILGMMPHPEGYMRASQHPGYFKNQTQDPMSEGLGLRLFKNAFHLAKRIENPVPGLNRSSTQPNLNTETRHELQA